MTSDGRNLPVLLTTEELATMLHLSPRSIEDWRIDGKGPPHIKMGTSKTSRILYRLDVVEEWLDKQQSK